MIVEYGFSVALPARLYSFHYSLEVALLTYAHIEPLLFTLAHRGFMGHYFTF